MNIYDATEQAYRNGYSAGYAAGLKDSSVTFVSAWVDTAAQAVKVCFTIHDEYKQIALPLSLEDIRILAHKICPEKYDRPYGNEDV